MRKSGLFSCGSRGVPYLNYEILWTPVLRARLESHAWLADLTAVDGQVFDGKGIIVIVKLHETEDDHRQDRAARSANCANVIGVVMRATTSLTRAPAPSAIAR
jgi:hypothetical protein